MAWERGTNEYFCLPCATILWCPSYQLPEDKGNNETHLLASTELSGLEGDSMKMGNTFWPNWAMKT